MTHSDENWSTRANRPLRVHLQVSARDAEADAGSATVPVAPGWQTELWLAAQEVPFDELHMRRHRDNRKDSIVKRELYEAHVAGRCDIAFAIDDRQQAVEMWRDELGFTVFQCAEGDF